MSADVDSMNPLTVEFFILVLCAYLFPVNSLSKQKGTVRRGMMKKSVLNIILYAGCLIDLNNYLD